MTYLPPEGPKPKSNLRKILVIVAIVLVLCCGGAAVGGYFLVRGVQEATGPARDAATAYVDDLIAGDYQGAYGRLCDRVKASTSEADYTRVQSAQLKISKYEVVGTNIQQRNATTTAVITMRLTQKETGAALTQGFPLLKEDGEWRIC